MLVINQGVQNTKDDNKFDVIKEKGVFGKITEVKLHETFENTLTIVIDIIDNEKYKGRKIFDNVTFDPTSEFAWKYRSLRKCIGKPYVEGENPKIDIEKLMVGKKVKMNLDGRIGNDDKEYQKVAYVARAAAPVETVVEEEEPVDTESDIEDDVAW